MHCLVQSLVVAVVAGRLGAVDGRHRMVVGDRTLVAGEIDPIVIDPGTLVVVT